MSYEKIQRITFNNKEKKVYFTSKSNNDNCPYTRWECEYFSKMWQDGNKRMVEVEIVKKFLGYNYQLTSYKYLNKYYLAFLEYKKQHTDDGYGTCEKEIRRCLEFVENYENKAIILMNKSKNNYISDVKGDGSCSITSCQENATIFKNALYAKATNSKFADYGYKPVYI